MADGQRPVMAPHRVALLGSRMRRYENPETSYDPRVRAVVAQLRAVELPGPSDTFRSELRTQLVAVAPGLIAEGAAQERPASGGAVALAERGSHAAGSVAARTHHRPAHGRRRLELKRPLIAVATLLTIGVLVLSGAVWLSRSALPGDTLYGLKRTSEDVQLHFASSDVDRATDYLKLSQKRVAEARALAGRASAAGVGINASGVSAGNARLITQTLGSADAQLKAGWVLLADSAEKSRSTKPLATMTGWAPGQIVRLRQLAELLPDAALRSRATTSGKLAQFALDSAQTLRQKITSAARPTTSSPWPTTGRAATRSHGASTATRSASPRTSTGSAATDSGTANRSNGTGSGNGSGSGSGSGNGSSNNSDNGSGSGNSNRGAPGQGGNLPNAATSSAGPRVNLPITSAVPTTIPTKILPTSLVPTLPVNLTTAPVRAGCGVTLPGGLTLSTCSAH